jgi:predicted NACHT family NTPase
VWSECKYLFTNINRYYEENEKYYSEIKTLLNKEEPRLLKDVYEPLYFSYKETKSKISFENLSKVNNCVILSGIAGSGKSTAMKFLFTDCVNNYYHIPLFIRLRDKDFVNEHSLYNIIIDQLFMYSITDNKKIANRIIKSGGFFFIMDGYDELSPKNQRKFILSINHMTELYSNNYYILTSRPNTTSNYIIGFSVVDICKLEEQQIISLIHRFREKKLATEIVKSLELSATNNYLHQFVENPLFLCLYMLTFTRFSEVPNLKSTFYHRVIIALFVEHDSISKPGYKRKKYCEISSDQVINILEVFSLYLTCDNKFSFLQPKMHQIINKAKKINDIEFNNEDFLNDMLISYCIWIEDSGIYYFIHRSIQEYLCAKYLSTSNHKVDILKSLLIKSSSLDNFLSIYRELNEFSYLKDVCQYIIQYCIGHLEAYETLQDFIIESVVIEEKIKGGKQNLLFTDIFTFIDNSLHYLPNRNQMLLKEMDAIKYKLHVPEGLPIVKNGNENYRIDKSRLKRNICTLTIKDYIQYFQDCSINVSSRLSKLDKDIDLDDLFNV